MDKKPDILDIAKGLLKHLQENPTDLKKFEEKKPAAAPAAKPATKPAPRKEIKPAFDPYFLSKARANEIGQMLAKNCAPMAPAKAPMKKTLQTGIMATEKKPLAKPAAKPLMPKPAGKVEMQPYGKKELNPGKSQKHPANGKLMSKEEKKAEPGRDPSGEAPKPGKK